MHTCKPVDERFFDTAALSGDITREMAVGAMQLFSTFEDDRTWCQWVPVIQRIDWTSPLPRGPGATRIATLSLGIKLDELFWAWDPGRHLGFRVTACNLPMLEALIESYEITPLSDTRCRLRWRMAMDFKGPSRFIGKHMTPSIHGTMQRVLARLEQVAARMPAINAGQ